MKLENLLKGIKFEILQGGANEIKGSNLEFDSRNIKENDVFIALSGAVVDGHDYIEKAIEKGAKIILVEKNIPMKEEITYIKVENLRENMGYIASNFYDSPQDKLKIVGITGTNGKTTITYILETLLGSENIGRIGTVEYKIGDEVIPAENTTPSSLELIKLCKKAVDKNIKYLIMEVSSHGLEIGRVNMLDFEVGVFTNLTQDHLDYHKTMDNYFEAKKKLFNLLKNKKSSVINIDDKYGKKYHEYTGGLSYSLEVGDIKGKINHISRNGQEVEIEILGKKYATTLNILGRYNFYNVLAGIGVAKLLGLEDEEIISKLHEIKGAPGRFEIVKINRDFTAVVDYAHTSDALENILKSINEFKTSRVITVFGCGGDRDKTKRPLMARAAEKYSDIVIATSDNPRTEDPTSILEDVVKGFEGRDYLVEIDRTEAIKKAVKLAEKDDIILIAGKGHEDYQIIGREKFHFDDREKVLEAIESL